MIGRLGVGIYLTCVPLPNCISLWLNHKFQILYRRTTQHTPTSNSESLSSFSLDSQVYRKLHGQNGGFPYWIQMNYLKLRELKCSLKQSDRIHASASTCWSCSTEGLFASFVSGLRNQARYIHIRSALNTCTQHVEIT